MAGETLTDVQRGGALDGGDNVALEYARDKVREFQATLNAIDATAGALRDALQWAAGDDAAAIDELLTDYESRKLWIRGVAQAINAGAAAANWSGVRMPSLSIPSGLGALQVVAMGAALAAAAAVISWGVAWIATAGDRLRAQTDASVTQARIDAAQSLPPADAARELERIEAARDSARAALARIDAHSGGFFGLPGGVLNLITLAALGVAGYALWRAFAGRDKGGD